MSEESAYISAFCRMCQMPRYRSIRPMKRSDEARPNMFKALDPGAPEPTEGPARCHVCDNILVFMPDTPLAPSTPVRNPPLVQRAVVDPKAPPELFQPTSQDDPPPTMADILLSSPVIPNPSVEVLFELQPGEEFKSFNGTLLITNKRIVKVNHG